MSSRKKEQIIFLTVKATARLAQAIPMGPVIYKHCKLHKDTVHINLIFFSYLQYLPIRSLFCNNNLYRAFNPNFTLGSSLIKCQGSVSYIWHELVSFCISCKLQVINALLRPRTHLITSWNAPSCKTASWFNC